MKKRLFLSINILICLTSGLAFARSEKAPSRLMVLVFDAMRPDYIDRFDLKNFKRLKLMSTNYSEAYVGHLFSETVVAHAVIPTGLPPRLLPWADDMFLDKDGRLGKPDAFYITGDLSGEQLTSLLADLPPHAFIQSRLKNVLNGKLYAVGAKNYAAAIFAGPYADGYVTMKKELGKCKPAGRAVPEYISSDDRFTIDCSDTFGTAMSFYPLDGAKHVPGKDPKHLGGDTWTADVALKIMDQENAVWRTLFLTFSGIDKISHLLGEHEGPRAHDFTPDVTFEQIIKNADAQLGRILDDLGRRKLLDSTMLVVTADHGGQGNRHYYGVGGKAHTGEVANDSTPAANTIFWIEQLRRNAKVRATLVDSAIRVWLTEQTDENRKKATASLAQMPGISGVYERVKREPVGAEQGTDPATLPGDYTYKRVADKLSSQSKKFAQWEQAHAIELLESMASERAPDLVALIEDDVGYGLLGDHGGAQEKVQRVPLMVYVPGKRAAVRKDAIRHRDLRALIEKEMDL